MGESAAFRLLAACGRHAHRSDRHDAVEGFLDGVDWSELLALVRRHGASPHAWLCLSALPSVPEEVRAWLARRRGQIARQMLRVSACTAETVAAMEARRIDVVALKGAPLALDLLGDPTLRESSDIDLLVPPAAIADADAVLRGLGFTPTIAHFDRPIHRRYFAALINELQYVDTRRGLLVELHWRPTSNPYLLDLPKGWPLEAVTVSIGGTDIRVLPALDQIAYLSLHASSHNWSLLRWLFDFAPLLDRVPDVGDIERHARRLGCWPAVSDMLVLCREVLKMSLPSSIAQDASFVSRIARARAAIAGSEEMTVSSWRRFWSESRHRSRRWSYRAYEAMALMLRATADWQQFPLPAPLLPLYVPLRPIFKLLRDRRAAAGDPQVIRLRDHYVDGESS